MSNSPLRQANRGDTSHQNSSVGRKQGVTPSPVQYQNADRVKAQGNQIMPRPIQSINDLKDLIRHSGAHRCISLDYEGELLCLNIYHPVGSATIALQGAHLMRWQPAEQRPVLWMSCMSEKRDNHPIRGGIPVCWPWFGVNDQGNHGLVRTRPWQLDKIDNLPASLGLTFSLDHASDSGQLIRLQMRMEFSDKLSQFLNCDNCSQQGFPFSAALHSYFAVSHSQQIAIPTLHNKAYQDKLDNYNNAVQHSIPSGQGPLDRIFRYCGKQLIVDSGWNRKIRINAYDSNHWVLWNPGPQWVKQFADILPGTEQQFVCLETAIVEDITIPAGSQYQWGHQIESIKL